MKQITTPQIVTFAALFGIIAVSGVGTTALVLGRLPLGDFRGVVLMVAGVVITYLYAFAVYRLFLRWRPLQEGDLADGSAGEFAAQVNILFYLLLFNSLIRTHFLPVPLLRLVYLALGARLGPNTYSAGVLLDPPLTTFGRDCIIGHDACLYAHAIEGDRFALSRIVAGDRVTIGATAVVMSGVHIGDDAIVSAGAVVLKGTRIAAGEVWGGVPARRLRAGPLSAFSSFQRSVGSPAPGQSIESASRTEKGLVRGPFCDGLEARYDFLQLSSCGGEQPRRRPEGPATPGPESRVPARPR